MAKIRDFYHPYASNDLREIDRSIGEYEKELETVFAEAGIERLEIDMGTLVRYARTDGGFDWKIEI